MAKRALRLEYLSAGRGVRLSRGAAGQHPENQPSPHIGLAYARRTPARNLYECFWKGEEKTKSAATEIRRSIEETMKITFHRPVEAAQSFFTACWRLRGGAASERQGTSEFRT
jgi:hypothetical protein